MIPLLAVLSVLPCMVAKMFLALQTKAMEKKLGRFREVLHEAKKEEGKGFWMRKGDSLSRNASLSGPH